MKMIVSDFDGTFYLSNDDDMKKNKKQVKEFIKNNVFTIATGRSYYDFKVDDYKYDLNYSYLIINHGASIIKNNEIIYNISIDNNIKNELIKFLKVDTAIQLIVCSKLESRLKLEDDDLTKIHVRYKTKEEAKVIYDLIVKEYSKYVNCFYVWEKEGIEIVDKKVDKSKAIDYVANLENIDKRDIYTIGDSYNDIEMIKRYNGSVMTNSIDEVYNISDKKYDSVSKLIIDVMRSNNE